MNAFFLNVDITKQCAIFGMHCLRQSDKRTNRSKTRQRVNTLLNVIVEDRSCKASSLAKIEFGQKYLYDLVVYKLIY